MADKKVSSILDNSDDEIEAIYRTLPDMGEDRV